MARKINDAGLELVKQFEGCRLKAYQDSVGIWTIGYGHTGGVKQGQVVTRAEAEALLRSDLAEAEEGVDAIVPASLTDNQFSALVSFAFNLGAGNLRKSTLRKKLWANDFAGAADEFLRWNKAGGKELAGLTRRRKAERTLFLKP